MGAFFFGLITHLSAVELLSATRIKEAGSDQGGEFDKTSLYFT